MVRRSQRRSLAVSTVVAVALALAWARPALADNPIIQTNYTADPAPLVHDDTVYLYTSHDEDNATGFTMYNWMLYSSTDLVNWTDHGMIGGVKDPYKTFKWSDGNNAWAPQVVFRNDHFYLYAPFPKSGHMVIGVAVADRPEGPFVDALGGPLVNNPNSSNDIDPTAFIDEDGQAYLYWGHQPSVFYVKLNEDMISYSGSIVQVTRPQTYEEGPWFYRRNNLYYLAFASTCCPEGIGYATSSAATGPWTFKGSIMDGASQSSGNHPGIIDYKGGSYVFGFDYAVQLTREGQRLGERRSVCLQQFEYGADGSIPKLPFWKDAGVDQLGTLNPYAQTEAETIAWAWDVKTEPCNEGGMDVTAIQKGDYVKVKGVDFGAGAATLDVRAAATQAGGSIEAHLDSLTGKLVATCSVPNTGGAQTWATQTCDVTDATGVHDLFFVFNGGSGSLFNFNWWRFHAASSMSGGVGGASGGGAPSAGASAGGASGSGANGGTNGEGTAGATVGASGAPAGGRSGGSSVGGAPGAGAGAGARGGINGGPAAGRSGAGGPASGTSAVGGSAAAGAPVGTPGAAGRAAPSGGSTSGAANESGGGCGCSVPRRDSRLNGAIAAAFGIVAVRRVRRRRRERPTRR
jgi:hypothetical protein